MKNVTKKIILSDVSAVPYDWLYQNSTFTSEIFFENQENYIYINPDLNDVIKRNLEGKQIRKDFTDHYLYLCGTINYLHSVDKRYKDLEYSPINYRVMSSIISERKYSEIIDNLMQWKVIESDQSYQTGKRSKSYKLLHPFDQHVMKYRLTDKTINQKLNKHKNSLQKKVKELPFVYQYLNMTNKRIRIDSQRAFDYNQTTYGNPEMKGVHDANFYSISAYGDFNYRFTVDHTGNRVHTNLTNLKSDLRQFLSVSGEPLVQVDIRNSQPLFFYLHIKDIPTIPDSEKEAYKVLVESGSFYEFFMQKLNIPSEKRDKFKPKILAALFFDHYRTKESRYITVFKAEYPHITEYIRHKKLLNHRDLAILLQRTESKFVIETVVAKFVEKFGRKFEFISTIHDSIVVEARLLDEASKILKDCFRSIRLQPQISEKFF